MDAQEDASRTQFWKLPIPPKVKNFLWQACSNILPTADNLHMKHVPCPIHCNLCSSHPESIAHLFISCSFTKDCWRKLNILNVNNANQFHNWISNNMKAPDSNLLCLLLVTCWKIWEARNHKVWSNSPPNYVAVVDGARGFLNAWSNMQIVNLKTENCLHNSRWQKPPLGWTKMNIDAACYNELCITSMGFIIRDAEGN